MNSQDVLGQAIAAVMGAINSYGTGVLQSDGQSLFAGLALITISWMGIRIMLEAGAVTDIMGSLMRTMLMIGMVYWILSPAGYDLVFKQGIDGTMNALAEKLSPSGTPQNALTNSMSVIIGHAVAIGDKIYTTWLRDAGPLDVIGILAKNFFSLLYLSLAIVMIFLAACVYFAVGITSIIMIQIALILGPIFIPWMLIPFTSFLFEGWLRFLIVGGLTKVVGALLIGIASATLSAITINLTGDFGQTLMMSMAAAGIALLAAYLMSQIPNIAQALVSGGAGMSMIQAVRGINKAGQGAPGTAGDIAGSAGVGAGKGMQAAGSALQKTGSSAASLGSKAGGKAAAAGNAINGVVGGAGNVTSSAGKKLENFSRGGSTGGPKGGGSNNSSKGKP